MPRMEAHSIRVCLVCANTLSDILKINDIPFPCAPPPPNGIPHRRNAAAATPPLSQTPRYIRNGGFGVQCSFTGERRAAPHLMSRQPNCGYLGNPHDRDGRRVAYPQRRELWQLYYLSS